MKHFLELLERISFDDNHESSITDANIQMTEAMMMEIKSLPKKEKMVAINMMREARSSNRRALK